MGVVILFFHLQKSIERMQISGIERAESFPDRAHLSLLQRPVIRLSIASAENAVYGLKAIALNNESSIDPRRLHPQSMLSQKVEPSAELSLMLICVSGAKAGLSVTTARKIHDIQGYEPCSERLSSPERPGSIQAASQFTF